jgi:tryptophan synthase alpha chain
MASGEERIAAAFAAARDEGRAALMPYMMGCFPDRAGALAIAEAYVEGGADLVELGIPFSDPLADGPVIHAAATAALANGATLEDALEPCSVLDQAPAVAMCYANMVFALGAGRFASGLASAGAAGAIVPDLPLEEADELRGALASEGLALVPLVAPTTPPERRARIAAAARGFVYAVSDVGVTGEREELPEELADFLAELRERSPVPVAVGFGIGTPDQAAAMGRRADGVIIGSRLVRAASEAPDGRGAASAVREFLASCRAALAVG